MAHRFLPRDIYYIGGGVIDRALTLKSSLNSLCYNSKFGNKKKLLALLIKTLSYKHFLDEMIKNVVIPIKKSLSYGILLAILYEHIFGIRHRDIFWRNLLKPYDEEFKKFLTSYMLQHKIVNKKNVCTQTVRVPRCVRINTLKIDINMAIDYFQKIGFCLSSAEFESYNGYLQLERSLNKKEFVRDPLFPNILTFHCSVDIHDEEIVKNGAAILQDKASCIPPFVLNPPAYSYVLDCCAAPGNKTSQLCEIMKNKGHLIAIDNNFKRLETMKIFLKIRGCDFDAIKADFLTIDPHQCPYNKVEYILLDPSCSSSGVVKLHDQILKTGISTEEKLRKAKIKSEFQFEALCHALSFPKLKFLVYSTCSIYEIENENVVKKAYQKWKHLFRIEHILKDWPLRGLKKYRSLGKKCLRSEPEITNSNGFFVAKFTRRRNNKRFPSCFFTRSNLEYFQDFHRFTFSNTIRV